MSTAPHDAPPDVRQLARQPLPEAAFPGGRRPPFRVYFEPAVHERVWKHAEASPSVEICGVLVGQVARDAEGPFVLISESIEGEAAQNKFAEVTFTHATWAKINEQMDQRFAHLAIVGWYHSHPDFGVFLSDRDRFIQEHFFAGPGQVAYVVDPVRKTEGVFAWHEGKPTLAPHYWVGDRVQVATAAGAEPAPDGAAPAAGAPAAAAAPDRWAPWLGVAVRAAWLLIAFLLGSLLTSRLSDLERFHIERSARADAWLWLKIRPGLRDELEQARSDLRSATEEARDLAQEHLKLLPEPGEMQTRWQNVLDRLGKSRQRLAQAQDQYALTAEEEQLLKGLEQAAARRAAPDRPADAPGTAQTPATGATKKQD